MKYVLVTGARGGMGTATTKMLAKNGYHVIALDRQEFEPTEGVTSVTCDVTDERSVIDAFSKVKEITDSLHAVIHYAGVYMLDSLIEISAEEFEKIFKINLFGVYLVNKTFLPLLKSGSRILITTSELAPLDPLPFTGIYAVSKAALDKYAYSLRMELQLMDVAVSVLRAGAVNTGMLNVSTTALDKFCQSTRVYSVSSTRFKSIVGRVEARNITPERLAKKAIKIIGKRHPRFAYAINRNPLLLLLNALPKRLQLFIIKKILK